MSQGSEPTINQNLTFRAHRYPLDFEAFSDIDLTPEGVLELDPSPVVACGGIGGCTDSMACNYDETATIDDGSCDYLSCAGCTDPTACNYDATATIDDGSCESDSCAG